MVINLIGAEKETANFGFEEVNTEAAARIARLATEVGVAERLIHVSCLGASETASSRRLRTLVRSIDNLRACLQNKKAKHPCMAWVLHCALARWDILRRHVAGLQRQRE